MELFSPSLKNKKETFKKKLPVLKKWNKKTRWKTFYISGGNLQSPKIKKKKNAFPYIEGTFTKLKYFL